MKIDAAIAMTAIAGVDTADVIQYDASFGLARTKLEQRNGTAQA
jgi:hypothetical protein